MARFRFIVMVLVMLVSWNGVYAAQDQGLSSGVAAADLAGLAKESRWLELLAAATEQAAKNPSDARCVAYRLQALRMLGQVDEALKQADEALGKFPNQGDILVERAWLRVFKGQWPAALADARAAAANNPASEQAYLVQGVASRELHDWDNTLSAFSRAMQIAPSDPIPPLNCGRAYCEKARWREALNALSRCIELNPQAAEAYCLRGRAYAGLGRLAEADRDLNQSLRLNPRLASAYGERADLLARAGKWEAAAKDAYTAIVLGARDERPYVTACQAAVALGDWDALAQYAAGGMAVAPKQVAFYHFAGRAYREQGDLNKALATYEQALRLAPTDTSALAEHATTCIMLRRYAQAADDCTAALKVRPSAMLYALRGFARFKAGQPDGAYEDCTNAVTLEPKTVTALLVMANIDLASGRVAEAVGESAKALKLDPSQAWCYGTYGAALLAEGHAEAALKVLNQGLTLSPNDAQSHLIRGRCLAALGRTAQAREDLNKAAELDPALKAGIKDELARLKS